MEIVPWQPHSLVRALAEDLRLGGDTRAGQEIYRSIGCPSCHVTGAEGRPIGPDLSALGRGLPIEGIIVELLWPQTNVKEGYAATVVTTSDGQSIQGLLHSETTEELGIRDMLTGDLVRVRRADVASRSAGGSLMPDGLTAGLSRRALVDLLRYLASLGT